MKQPLFVLQTESISVLKDERAHIVLWQSGDLSKAVKIHIVIKNDVKVISFSWIIAQTDVCSKVFNRTIVLNKRIDRQFGIKHNQSFHPCYVQIDLLIAAVKI
jgi:hypothetical protein